MLAAARSTGRSTFIKIR